MSQASKRLTDKIDPTGSVWWCGSRDTSRGGTRGRSCISNCSMIKYVQTCRDENVIGRKVIAKDTGFKANML